MSTATDPARADPHAPTRVPSAASPAAAAAVDVSAASRRPVDPDAADGQAPDPDWLGGGIDTLGACPAHASRPR